MYPLDRGAWGPTVRIRALRDALARRVRLEVIAGDRGRRRLAELRYVAGGRIGDLDGIYVESSSFLPAETDLAFLAIARARGVPVLTYVRDAYQLFEDYYPRDTVKRRIGAALFRPTIAALRRVSSRLAVPTAGMAAAIGEPSALLLPPGSPTPVDVPVDPAATGLLFVGDARMPAHGADRLIAAVGKARDQGIEVGLTLVTRPGQEPPPPHPAWVRIRRAEGEAIHDLLPGIVATTIPRPRNAYNDLALPIKLFDYLSYGRPLLVTDCLEQAAIVRAAEAGVVAGDDVESLAGGIRRVLDAPASERARWSGNAHRAAREAAWERRAEMIVEALSR